MSIVCHDDFGHATKRIVLKIDGNCRGVCIKAVPNELRNRRNGLCRRLPLEKVRLNFDGVFSHQLASVPSNFWEWSVV
jgi:hypothetical protein